MNPKYEERVGFESVNPGGRFQPEKVADVASRMEAEYNSYLNSLTPYERSLQERDKAKIANAGIKNRENVETYRALSDFSKTAADYVTKVEEQSKKDREDGEVYDYLFGGADLKPQDQQDAETADIGEAQGPVVAQMAVDADNQAGTPVAGQAIRQSLGGLAEGVAGERGLLINAQTSYSGWLSTWLQSDNMIDVNGTQMPVRAAAMSADPGIRQLAITQGRFAFIRQFGLAGATKRNVVKYLANTMIQAEAAMGGAIGRSAVQAVRDQNIEQVEGMAYGAARNGSASEVQSSYNGFSEQLFVQNTGLTRGQASDQAITAMLAGYVESGNTDAIEAMLDVQRVPGQAGTELRFTHGQEIDQALRNARGRKEENDNNIKDDIEAQMYRDLNGVEGLAERTQIVEQAATQLEAKGLYEDARTLRLQQAALSTPGTTDINATELEQGIIDGEIRDQKQIDQARARGLITQADHTALTRQLNAVTEARTPKDENTKGIVKSYVGRWTSEFMPLVGLRRDPVTKELTVLPGTTSIVTPGEAGIINTAVQQDMNAVANTAYAQNSGLPAPQRDAAVRTALQNWWTDNVMTKGGKYYIGDLVTPANQTLDDNQKAQREYWTGLANNPIKLSTPSPGRTNVDQLGRNDLSDEVKPGTPLTPQQASRFNPLRGDTLIPQPDLVGYRQQMEQGIVPPELVIYSQSVGMSPLALLNQQINAYPDLGLEPLSPVRGNKPGTAQSYMTMGLPPNTARFMSQNGIVVNEDQINEFAANNKDAWRVVRNSYSTPRQLREALSTLMPKTPQSELPPPERSQAPFQGILGLIRSGEGSYDSANRGYAGDTPGGVPGLSGKTLGEWKQLQRSGYNALGAYQFIPGTLAMAARQLGLSDSTVMSKEVQDRLAIQLMTGSKRPRLAAYLNGSSNDLDAALDDLALEWASVATAGGGTAYPNVGGNAASISRGSARQQLIQLRNALTG